MHVMHNALITGASSGMGLAFCRQLAAEGCALAMVSNRGDDLEREAARIREAYGVPVLTRCTDLARPDAAEILVAWCDENGFSPDILINNAGIFFMEYLGSANLEKARTMMHLHMDCVTGLCILFGERMKAEGAGHILNMASMTARIPAPGIAVYSATKAYLDSFGKGFGHELRPYGVTLTTVCPAAVDTGLYPLPERLRGTLRRLGVIRSPEWMVRRSLRAMRRGRRTLSPGLSNALIPPLIKILPARLIDKLGVKWIYRKTATSSSPEPPRG